MTFIVVGLGALGTTFATLLKKAGHKVFALVKERQLAALSTCRVGITGIWGGHEAVLDGIYAGVEPLMRQGVDIIILTVKSFDTSQAISMITPLVGRDVIVMSAQNGYGNYETVAHLVGKEHAILARIIFGARIVGAGRSEITVIADKVRIGQPDDAIPADVVRHIASEIDKAGIPTAYAPNVNEILWDKILYNCALNPLGALLDCNYGSLAENRDTREIMNALIREVFSVAAANSIRLQWKGPDEYITYFYEKLVPPTKEHYPSMYHDLKAGKRLEIDALNGAIVRLGLIKGISVPVNETVTRLIRAKQAISVDK
ncbi:MAG TPA: 2-dehydropantoate 2-reductase [Dissulfurispiraceae bacterium]|nr:2-dehydropantoate 2-reductase [Dissulfurispiraceae bacterium]